MLLVMCGICAILNFKWIVETKNKTPIEIVRALSNVHLRNMLCCSNEE